MHMGMSLCLELFIREDKEQENGGGGVWISSPAPSISSRSQLHLSREKKAPEAKRRTAP